MKFTINKILVIDYGSQYTQLIARRIRELQTYCEVIPFHKVNKKNLSDKSLYGIILSGGPNSVKDNILKIDGIKDVNLKLVWDPPWSKDKMSEAAKLELNL